MKTVKIILLALLLTAGMPAMAKNVKGIEIKKTDGEALHIANTAINSMTFAGDDMILTSSEGQELIIPRAGISSISPSDAIATEYSVSYDATGASVINPYVFQGVSTVIDGAYVLTENTNVTEELVFNLGGTTDDGAFEYHGDYKCTLRLDGVAIASRRGAAVSILCGKRIAVELVEGTVSTLSDMAGGDQKAALYFKGHPEFAKGGALQVTGRTKHAISSKEYIQLKKTVGCIDVLGAASDGIHAGQYFQMNGGTVTIRNVGGDGIQAEATSDETDELNGQMIIKGGTIDIVCPGVNVDALKADSLFTILDGRIILTVTGDGTATNPDAATVTGGWPNPGGSSGVDTWCSAAIKAKTDLLISGGELTLLATGKGGKCIKVEGNMTIDGTPKIDASTTGGVVVSSGSGMNAELSGQPKAVKVEGDIVINGGDIRTTTKQNGGEGIESKKTITINGGTVVANTYDDGINAAQKITINGGVIWSWATNNDGMDCNGSAGFEINGGIVLSSGASSPEEGFDCDNYKFVINGGTVFGTGGSTSNVTSATQPYRQQTGQSLTKDTYLCLQKTDGTVICGYKVPHSLNATVVVSSPEFQSGTSYKLVRNAAIASPKESYLDGRFVIGGTLSGGTSTTISPKTK